MFFWGRVKLFAVLYPMHILGKEQIRRRRSSANFSLEHPEASSSSGMTESQPMRVRSNPDKNSLVLVDRIAK